MLYDECMNSGPSTAQVTAGYVLLATCSAGTAAATSTTTSTAAPSFSFSVCVCVSLSLACVLLGTSKPMRLDLGLLGKQEGHLGQEPVAPKAGPKINRAEAHTHA